MPDNTADDISTDIANGATQPRSATVDGNSVTQQSVSDKILARNDAAGIAARNNTAGSLGLTMRKLRPTYE